MEAQSFCPSSLGSLDRKKRFSSSRGVYDTGRGYYFSLSRLPGVPGPEGVVISDPATSQVLTSGGRYGGLFALLPLFLPFFFFPFGPPQLLLPPAPLALSRPEGRDGP